MPALFLLTPGTRASLERERLCIQVPAEEEDRAPEEHSVPLWDLEHVLLSEHAHLTIPALAELLRRGIPVFVMGHGDELVGACVPPAPHTAVRLAQYRRAEDSSFVLAISANWVEAKILNSRRVLQRLAANREDADVRETVEELTQLARKCLTAETLETLRGYEGAAAGRYFEALARFFPPHCPFERRSRRPPHNAANAVLSYAYTLLTAEMECCLHTIGLDPAIGFFHEPADRRPALALDLIEPFRAPFADALALDLINHGILKPDKHFESRDGGVYMNRDGKRQFFVAYERRINREFLSEHTGQRTTIRRALRDQALALKQAIQNREPFEPFLMN